MGQEQKDVINQPMTIPVMSLHCIIEYNAYTYEFSASNLKTILDYIANFWNVLLIFL